MTAVSASSGVSARLLLSPSVALKEPTLMPPPDSSAPILDSFSMLYLIEAKDQSVGLSTARTKVMAMTKDREVHIQEAIHQINQAVQEAEEAKRHHSFWDSIGGVLGTVAKVAGVVASVAVAVCSFGAGTPLAVLAVAGAVLSTASFVDSEAHILEKLGVDAGTAGWIDLGASLGGAVATGGAGALGATSGVATATTLAAKGAEAGAHIVRGVDTLEQAKFHAHEEDDFANALAEQKQVERMRQALFRYIDDVKAEQDEGQRRLTHIQGAMEAQDAAMSAAVRV